MDVSVKGTSVKRIFIDLTTDEDAVPVLKGKNKVEEDDTADRALGKGGWIHAPYGPSIVMPPQNKRKAEVTPDAFSVGPVKRLKYTITKSKKELSGRDINRSHKIWPFQESILPYLRTGETLDSFFDLTIKQTADLIIDDVMTANLMDQALLYEVLHTPMKALLHTDPRHKPAVPWLLLPDKCHAHIEAVLTEEILDADVEQATRWINQAIDAIAPVREWQDLREEAEPWEVIYQMDVWTVPGSWIAIKALEGPIYKQMAWEESDVKVLESEVPEGVVNWINATKFLMRKYTDKFTSLCKRDIYPLTTLNKGI